MKAGERYPATVPHIRERLADQLRRHGYAVTLEQAHAVLDRLSQDGPTLTPIISMDVSICRHW